MGNLFTLWASDLNWVLVGVVMVSWLATALALLALKQARTQAQDTRQVLQQLQRDLSVNSSGLMGMGKKLLTIEKSIKPSLKKHTKPERKVIPIAQAQDIRLKQARTMLEQGLSQEQVASAAGLSLAEVSLLARLNSSFSASAQ